MESLGETFASVPDPRAGNARHDLAEILVIAFAATLCGAETCCDMALFGRAKEPLLRELLALPHGIPSHDTFSRVFRFLDPAAFEMAFRRFTAAFAERLSGRTGLAGTVVAIDGKSLAGACEAGARATPLHLVTAWAADQRLVLAQRRAPGRSEVTAALEVVGMLDLLGATVTADALHGTRRMAAAIRARGSHVISGRQSNRGPLHRAMRDLLQGADGPPAQAKPRMAAARSAPPWCGRSRRTGSASASRGLRRWPAPIPCGTPAPRPRASPRYFALSRPLPAQETLHRERPGSILVGGPLGALSGLLGELHAKRCDLNLHQQGLDTSTPSRASDAVRLGAREKGVVLPYPHEFVERFRWRLATQVASVALEFPHVRDAVQSLKPKAFGVRQSRACSCSTLLCSCATTSSRGLGVVPGPGRDGRIDPPHRQGRRLLVEVVHETHKLGSQMQVDNCCHSCRARLSITACPSGRAGACLGRGRGGSIDGSRTAT